MKILLINPPSEFTAPEFFDPQSPDSSGTVDTEDFGLFPPLGLLYIHASLRNKAPQHEVVLLDCIAERIGHADLAGKVAEVAPDVVGITSYTYSLYDVCLAARTVRSVRGDIHICMGGHHPIAFPLEAAALPEFDSVVVGEGEEAFVALVDALATGTPITTITGVYTRDSIKQCASANETTTRLLTAAPVPAAYISNLDDLPTPDRRIIQHLQYRSVVGSSNQLATMISSRGCPYGCIYCEVPYKQYRKRSIPMVADEIRGCLDLGYREVHFYDDLFNITPERVLEFCDAIQRRGYKLDWDFRGRVNSVTRESLVRAKQAGCRLISFGVETGSDEGLLYLNKNTTTAQIRNVFRWCRELGIMTVADFMIGLPFERTAADVRRNIDFLLELDPDYAQFSILSLYPNTEVFAQAVQRGLVDPARWAAFLQSPRPFFHVDHWEEYLPAAQLLQLQREAYRRFYLRPRYIWRSLISTSTRHELMSKLVGALKILRR